MDYAAHYERLIARARGRALEGYRERHHVIPRCLGGGNDPANIVELTAEEHYVAHQLLLKMRPCHRGLVSAAMAMARRCSGNKAYGWLCRRNAIASSIALTGKKRQPFSVEHRANIGKASLGRRKSPETRAKIAAALMGKPCSSERRAKIGAANRGRKLPPFSEETRAKMAAALRGRPVSLETREKQARAMRGRSFSLEHRAKLSAARQRYVALCQGGA